MAAQVSRGYRADGRSILASASAATAPTLPNVTKKERRLKLERRNGSQSLSSSSSELQDSSPASSSPSSTSTLSLASSTVLARVIYKQAPSRATNNNNHHDINNKIYQQSSEKHANQIATSPQYRKSQQRQQQLSSWHRSSTQLNSCRSSSTAAKPFARLSSRGSLSSASNINSSNDSSSSSSNDSSRSNSSKLAAPPITLTSTSLLRIRAAASSKEARQQQQQRSSSINWRSSTRSSVPNSQDRTPRNHRLQIIHHGSLCSIASHFGQSRNQTREPTSLDNQHQHHHHSSLSAALLERIDHVRGQQQRLRGRQPNAIEQAQQFKHQQQSQVRQTRSCSVQQLDRISSNKTSASFGTSSGSIAAAAAAAAATRSQASNKQPFSPATTNSRLRQAALYARRHSHITQQSTTSTRSITTAPTATVGRCPLITRKNPPASLTRASSTLSRQHLLHHASSSYAPPRISSLRVSIGSSSSSSASSSKPIISALDRSFQRHHLIPSQEISSSKFILESSSSFKQQQQQTVNESRQRVRANNLRVARDRQLLGSRRTPSSLATTTLSNQPIGKSSLRSNLSSSRQPTQISASTRHISSLRMTTTLAPNVIGNTTRYANNQQPAAAAAAGLSSAAPGKKVASKNSGERSDGRSSSSSSSFASDSCCSGNASDCGSSSSSNEENVQPPSVTRNHLPARASNDSVAAAAAAAATAATGPEDDNNKNISINEENAKHIQVGGNNFTKGLPTINRINETTVDDKHLLLDASTIEPNKLAAETTAERPSDVVVVAAAAISDCQPKAMMNDSNGRVLVPRNFSLNIVNNINNNNNSIHQVIQQEENIVKRPLSDIERTDCNENRGQKQQDSTEFEMTNVKIKIQRKLSIAPDVSIKTEPMCLYYDLEARPFARGKFAQVKRCISKSTKQCFAAKCIKKRRRLVDIRHEIMLEIEALKLSYYTDHIVKLYEVFETPTEMILILEMANGGELQRVIDDEEAIDEKLVKRMIRQILEGLVQLHDNDIAHLDIKPQNLLLTEPFPEGDVKLCDFGISRRISKDCEIREICGTPDYVAPEILRYDPISLATDMWSLGVLTYVLLTGYSPFGSENRQQTFCNITQATLDFPSEIFYKISEDAVDFMQKLIVREPSERLTSQQARNHPWLCQ